MEVTLVYRGRYVRHSHLGLYREEGRGDTFSYMTQVKLTILLLILLFYLFFPDIVLVTVLSLNSMCCCCYSFCCYCYVVVFFEQLTLHIIFSNGVHIFF